MSICRCIPPLYAHRLGRAYGPDSSAAALAGALASGVDGLETDVCLTSDDELRPASRPAADAGDHARWLGAPAPCRRDPRRASSGSRPRADCRAAADPGRASRRGAPRPADPGRGQGACRPGARPPHGPGLLRALRAGPRAAPPRADQLPLRGLRHGGGLRLAIAPGRVGRLRARGAGRVGRRAAVSRGSRSSTSCWRQSSSRCFAWPVSASAAAPSTTPSCSPGSPSWRCRTRSAPIVRPSSAPRR